MKTLKKNLRLIVLQKKKNGITQRLTRNVQTGESTYSIKADSKIIEDLGLQSQFLAEDFGSKYDTTANKDDLKKQKPPKSKRTKLKKLPPPKYDFNAKYKFNKDDDDDLGRGFRRRK